MGRTFMVRNFLAFVLLAFCVAGCGAQGGRFVTTGCQSNAITPNSGCIDIIAGYETKQTNAEAGYSEQNLLYVIFITAAFQDHGSSSSDDYGKYVTTLVRAWTTDTGTLSASVLWNRQTDVITVGGREFDRTKGNVFIVKIDRDNKIEGEQSGELGPHALLSGLESQ